MIANEIFDELHCVIPQPYIFKGKISQAVYLKVPLALPSGLRLGHRSFVSEMLVAAKHSSVSFSTRGNFLMARFLSSDD